MLYTAMKTVVERFSVYRPCGAMRFRLDRIQLHAFLIKSSHEAKVGKFPLLTYANVPSNLLLQQSREGMRMFAVAMHCLLLPTSFYLLHVFSSDERIMVTSVNPSSCFICVTTHGTQPVHKSCESTIKTVGAIFCCPQIWLV